MVGKASAQGIEEPKFKDWDGFLAEFQSDSHRGAAILGGSFLDRHLRELIAAFLIDDEKEVTLLLGSDKLLDRPLSEFGARRRV